MMFPFNTPKNREVSLTFMIGITLMVLAGTFLMVTQPMHDAMALCLESKSYDTCHSALYR